MNILISDSWLRDFIETKATPKQIGEYLSLCSQSVEKIDKVGDDFVYDIEITTNRPDCLSVYGIARELSAILPRFKIEAKLKELKFLKIPKTENGLPLNIEISKKDLCPRFTALIYDNISIKSSPDFVQKRLNNAGVRALCNVIDISNYLMLELGQPMHTFDYDKILKHKMILRESKENEEIITLDGQKRVLKEGIIVIEDGEGRIVDLCGIMGAKNSETDENTKRVLLFVQTYNPMKIRRACQSLGLRTEAASRFEKGLDAEGVIPAMERATLLFKEWCGAKVGSKLFDIYPNPPKDKSVSVTKSKIDSLIGIPIKLDESKKILDNLGFKTKIDNKKESIAAFVPHWRAGDIEIPEDLVEEIARLYGYHNLPNVLPPISTLNYKKDPTFEWEDKIKTALKYWGFIETASYSLVGANLITDPANHLKIANPLTEDLLYLRISLIPSLLQVISDNIAAEEIKIFEMANVYPLQGNNKLPDEKMQLCLAINKDEFYKMKGFAEALLTELGITTPRFNECNIYKYMLHKTKCAGIYVNSDLAGVIGTINLETLESFGIKKPVTILNFDLKVLLKFANNGKKYTPLPKYPPIIEDLSFIFPSQTFIDPVIDQIKSVDKTVRKVELIDSYQDTRTFRITFQNENKNLSDKEVLEIRKKIIKTIQTKFAATLKT